eukprot:CAMPEP_0117448124 /NCGR_PEP_ID=MMETSP0759-20121206/7236_1 /TAXON_ID=63605 /ORGANISM="Percolomonas cosmopolitus, Strain WS" /LENGTH=232 /DNA_ID=CAMNT_0005240495 /DNA_START=101 /DNA_END=799 /DNA_ORIENTATION=+
MTILIGLTGSIATGKTTVGELLRQRLNKDHILKCYIDCDKIAHEILRKNNEKLIEALELMFKVEQIELDVHSEDVLDSEGFIDRPKLGEIIFKYPSLRRKWNKETHGKVFNEIVTQLWKHYSWKQWLPGAKQDVIILDMPLLFETPHVKRFLKRVICVSIQDEQVQMERLLKRNPKMTREEAHQRMRAQMSSKEKEKLSDYVIYNDGDLEALTRNVDTIYSQLKKDLHLNSG